MTCLEIREWLSAWLDEALTADERAAVDQHLTSCAECRRELDGLRGVTTLLRAVQPERAPAGFVDRILAAARPAPWYHRALRWLVSPVRVKLPIEAAAVLVVAATALYVYQQSPELREAARSVPAPSAPATGMPPRSPASTVSADAPAPAAELPATPAAPAKAGSPPTQAERAGSIAPRSERDTDAVAAKREDAVAAQERAVGRSLAKDAPTDAAGQRAPAADLRTEASGVQSSPPAGPPGEATMESKSEVARKSAEGVLTIREAPRAPEAQAKPLAVPPPVAGFRSSTAAVARSAEVSGRLAVGDRESARRALAALLLRVGGSEISRLPEAEGSQVEVVEVRLPRSAYPEFVQGLAGIGRWVPESESAERPDEVRILLRVGP